ncbi:hypothetical protein [Pedobacter hartonius]|uniref:Uncharacterized protein n=1 Tax=Pedobacter hartonius TaxID=425514 RepID=A0A1H4GH27_9SPHI|nr:hypothetical protein [Pedobacter hartonius]SEB08906.1 hypothetical protein SAMN05443550_11058 [Pedobacter hartonius]
MKIHINILAFCLLTGFSVIPACKKAEPQTKAIHDTESPGGTGQEKALIPLQIGTGKSKITFSYTADNSLSKVEYGDGTSTVLKYNTSGKPSALMSYQGLELRSFTQYTLDKDGWVVRANKYLVTDQGYDDAGNDVFTYYTASRLSQISHYNLQNKLLGTSQKFYSASGNVIRDQNSIDALSAGYLYDEKNGLFKNAGYAWLFAAEDGNKLFFSCINNVRACTYVLKPDLNQSFSYTYNTDGYPATVTSVSNGVTVSSKVTYRPAE